MALAMALRIIALALLVALACPRNVVDAHSEWRSRNREGIARGRASKRHLQVSPWFLPTSTASPATLCRNGEAQGSVVVRCRRVGAAAAAAPHPPLAARWPAVTRRAALPAAASPTAAWLALLACRTPFLVWPLACPVGSFCYRAARAAPSCCRRRKPMLAHVAPSHRPVPAVRPAHERPAVRLLLSQLDCAKRQARVPAVCARRPLHFRHRPVASVFGQDVWLVHAGGQAGGGSLREGGLNVRCGPACPLVVGCARTRGAPVALPAPRGPYRPPPADALALAPSRCSACGARTSWAGPAARGE